MAPGEEPLEALKYKVLMLRISIHCEGCKKRIYKILNKIEGVYKVDIDAQQKKVTVLGSVDADTLIKKLENSGKHAELLLEKSPIEPNPHNNTSSIQSVSKQECAAEKKPPPAQDSSTVAVACVAADASDEPEDKSKPVEAAERNNETTKSEEKEAEASAPLHDAPATAAAPNSSVDGQGNASASSEASTESNGGNKKEANEDSFGHDSGAVGILTPVQHMYRHPAYPAPPQAYVMMSYNMAAQPSFGHAHYASPMQAYPPPGELLYGTHDGRCLP